MPHIMKYIAALPSLYCAPSRRTQILFNSFDQVNWLNKCPTLWNILRDYRVFTVRPQGALKCFYILWPSKIPGQMPHINKHFAALPSLYCAPSRRTLIFYKTFDQVNCLGKYPILWNILRYFLIKLFFSSYLLNLKRYFNRISHVV